MLHKKSRLPTMKRERPTATLPKGLSAERILEVLRRKNFELKGARFIAEGRRLPKGARKALRKAALHHQAKFG
jgi:hypothetical protein